LIKETMQSDTKMHRKRERKPKPKRKQKG